MAHLDALQESLAQDGQQFNLVEERVDTGQIFLAVIRNHNAEV